VRQRAFADILLKQKGLAGVKFLQRRYDLVELGLHAPSDEDTLASHRKCFEHFQTLSNQSKCLFPRHGRLDEH